MADQQILVPENVGTARSPLVPALPTRFGPIQDFIRQPAVIRALPALALGGAIGLSALAYFAFQTPAQTPLFAGLAAFTQVTLGLLAGGLLAAPFAGYIAKRIPAKSLLLMVSIVLTATSLFSLYKALS